MDISHIYIEHREVRVYIEYSTVVVCVIALQICRKICIMSTKDLVKG